MNFLFYTPFHVITSPYQLDPIATLLLLRLGEKTEKDDEDKCDDENKEKEMKELQKKIKETLNLDILIKPINVFDEKEFEKIFKVAETKMTEIKDKLKKVEEIKADNTKNDNDKKNEIKKLFEEYLKGGGHILYEGTNPKDYIENVHKNILLNKEILLLKLFLIKYIMINIEYLKNIPDPEKHVIREKTQRIFDALAHLEGVIELTDKHKVLLKPETVIILDKYVRIILKFIIGK
jgi:hypothetical protein